MARNSRPDFDHIWVLVPGALAALLMGGALLVFSVRGSGLVVSVVLLVIVAARRSGQGNR